MWDYVVNYYEMAAKTVEDQAVKAALAIAHVKANRMKDAYEDIPEEKPIYIYDN